jgi:hypothetical protein
VHHNHNVEGVALTVTNAVMENLTMVSSLLTFSSSPLTFLTVGPYDTPHTDDGSSKWAKDMPHDAMLEFAKPYIAAFKTGSSTPIFEREMLVYWHRPTLKNVECDATDNCGSKPEGWEVSHNSKNHACSWN